MPPETIPGLNPVYEDYARCTHCGLCLNSCPTYRLWNLEADSPRGRIRQMIYVDEGKISITDSFVEHIDKCLDCRACETACPSGVGYGKLVEYARARIERDYRRPFFSRVARHLAYRNLLPYPKRIAAMARLLLLYQRSGLQSLARSSGFSKCWASPNANACFPPIDRSFFFDRLGQTYPAVGQPRARVAFFAGCVANVTSRNSRSHYPRVNCQRLRSVGSSRNNSAAARWPRTRAFATWLVHSHARIFTPSR